MEAQFMKDHWSDVKAALKQKYPELTANDLAYIAGREAEIFGRVEIRTGVNRAEVESFLLDSLRAA